MPDPAFSPTMTLEAAPMSVGALFADRYEVRGVLGEGGMGTVYRVSDRELDEEVALKVLAPELAQRRDALLRFRREVKLARRVTHPNVARTYDLGSHAGTRFLTMELIVGEPLSKQVARGRMSLPEVLRTASEIAKGLAAAHAVGVVHRDLKPDNVMIAGERVVLTDFGIAVLSEAFDTGALKTGAIVGTPAYMAPEQLEGKSVDGRTDVYALGIVLYELLTGRSPFGQSPLTALGERLTKAPRDPRETDPQLPEGVASLVLAALEPSREGRMDAATLLERIDALRGMAGPIASPSITHTPSVSVDPVVSRASAQTVAVVPFDSPTELGTLGSDLATAVADALSQERGVSVARSPSQADLVVEGSLRASGGRARVRVRMLDSRSQATAWADAIDGTIEDSFGLEDAVVTRVKDALRARVAQAGPRDPAVRAEYDRALANSHQFSLPLLRETIAILEKLHAENPDEPHVASLLGACLFGQWSQTAAMDAALVARAEDLSLRALDADPSIARTYVTLANIRAHSGEMRAGLRTVKQALALSPRLIEAHEFLGRLLCETLHVADGLRHLELALRVRPNAMLAMGARTLFLALSGDRPAAEEGLKNARAVGGPMSVIMMETRLAVWWADAPLAEDVANRIEQAKSGAAWDDAALLLRGVARGLPDPTVKDRLARLITPRSSPRWRSMMGEIAVEYLAWAGETEAAMGHLEALASLPFVNLFWMDRCPPLASLRSDPRFARVRAVTAQRANELWA